MNHAHCEALLREKDGFLIVTHLRPDGDTLGSAGALCSALRRLGKTAWLYPNPQITENYRPYVAAYLAPEGCTWDTVLAVDVADTTMFPLGFSCAVDLAIDHHPSNSGYARETLLGAEKAACGELILELITGLAGAPTPEEATLLYLALATDTGNFAYANTTADTFRAAAALADAGADRAEVNRTIRKVSPARLRLEGMVYDGLRIYRDGQLVTAVVSLGMMERAGATENDCDDLASLANRLNTGKVSVTIREIAPGECKVSLRTGREVNASEVCAVFGGGGHAMAAGCTIKASPEDAEAEMVRTIERFWP